MSSVFLSITSLILPLSPFNFFPSPVTRSPLGGGSRNRSYSMLLCVWKFGNSHLGSMYIVGCVLLKRNLNLDTTSVTFICLSNIYT